MIPRSVLSLLMCVAMLAVTISCEKNPMLSGEAAKPKNETAPQGQQKPKAESAKPQEVLQITGRVLNPHTEYLHTVIGFKTTDGKLLNLIFIGLHQQLVNGMYYRITYHRLHDARHIPEFVRRQQVDYFVLDNVELLPSPEYDGKQKSQKGNQL